MPIGTIGILSWVPLIRTAFVRRRAWDWVALIGTALLSLAAFVAVGSAPNEDSAQTTVGMITLLLLAAGSTVHFLVAELRTPPASQPAPQPAHLLQTYVQPYDPPWQAAPMAPLLPLAQVKAELDELSALLHQNQRPAP
ncbi:hypothetical protein [Streptacidiphilus pinicola]|uniref:hypothetical protein n=1 Tax=Streptacidiphilus pinicola TaxID=2219663 RepID=UPI001057D73B|nr:hypothetical protein [Streptacidiphilus pinicola]